MKIGLSSYSMVNKIKDASMSVTDVMRFAKNIGAAHIELVPFGFTLYDDASGQFNDELIDEIVRTSAEIDLPISNYAVLADLLKSDENERNAETERICRHVDVAHKLGISQMRHDISSFRRPIETNTPVDFEREFSSMVDSCRIIADYAAQFGISSMVENHGFFVNGSDRIIRLINAVDRSNFKMLLDIGNFACVDENCSVAVKKCAHLANMVHLKDFYIRKTSDLPNLGGLFRCDSGCWFSSNSGEYMLRGAILGQGDLEIEKILRIIDDSGFDGYASIEFEGMEDPKTGSEMGIDAAGFYLKK